MVHFRRLFPGFFQGRYFYRFKQFLTASCTNRNPGGRVIAQGWVYFFLGISILPLMVAAFFARQWTGCNLDAVGMRRIAGALLTRRYRIVAACLGLLAPSIVSAQGEHGGGEAHLVLPDLSSVSFFGMNGHALLMIGLLFCAGGLLFGLVIYTQLKNLPVHRTMREISELIYETCKTYLVTQGKFIVLLWVFIAVIISLYFGWLAPVPGKSIGVTLPIILGFSLVGIAGSYGGAWSGFRGTTFENSRA